MAAGLTPAKPRRAVTLLASGFEALEGPVGDEEGTLYVADLRAGGVHALDAQGRTIGVLVPERTRIGGLCLHAGGGLVISGPDLSHIHDGEARVLLALDEVPTRTGIRAVGFNDIHATGAGTVIAGVLRRDADDEPVPGDLLHVRRAARIRSDRRRHPSERHGLFG